MQKSEKCGIVIIVMEITTSRKIDNNSVLVFVLKETGFSKNSKQRPEIENHPFFKSLDRQDKDFLLDFQKKSPIKDSHSHLIYLPSRREVIFLGVPERKNWNHRKALITARRAVFFARRERVKGITINLEDFISNDFKNNAVRLAEVIAIQIEMANFEFVQYKEKPKEGWNFVESVVVFSKKSPKAVYASINSGKIIGEEINKARILSNTPGGDMTPKKLADDAIKSAKEAGFKIKVLEEQDIKKLKMGGVLGVSKGSNERPKFIIMEYMKGGKTEQPVVLVGKGVTFDTGGLNLKSEQGIYEMHMDMSGGAAVIHTVAAIARLKLKKNIIGIVPAVENMPSGSSYRPGDLLKTMSGKTIEVLNTDAEGRVILADGLTYAKKYNPSLIIDVATLTGSAMAALGQKASAIFTRSQKLERELRAVGEKTGDFVWPLPLWEEFEEDIKGTFGDVANVGKTRYGGAITGAVFLWQFVKNSSSDFLSLKKGNASYLNSNRDIPWVHIDIAPRMTSFEGEFLAKGAAGASIGLLVYFLRDNK